jgi:hypothetical protein
MAIIFSRIYLGICTPYCQLAYIFKNIFGEYLIPIAPIISIYINARIHQHNTGNTQGYRKVSYSIDTHENFDIIFVSIDNKNSSTIIKIFRPSIRLSDIPHQNLWYLISYCLSYYGEVSNNMKSNRINKIVKSLFVPTILTEICSLFCPQIPNKIVCKHDTFSAIKYRNYPARGYPSRNINNSHRFLPSGYPSR